MTTELSNAASPYILLHKDNPVQWRQWSPEVLAEAAAQDKPIFLSIGFMACHWCHVMNKESFADPATADFLNENFIPVIVDREERPDLDQIYQAAAQAMGHQGGWPLSMFLTPEGVPYFAAGYQPKEERLNMVSFTKALTDTLAIYQNDKPRLAETSTAVRNHITALYGRDMRTAPENLNIDLAAMRIAQRFDIFFGGLQGAMKFPNPSMLDVLWRAFLRTGTPQFSQLVFTTLDGILFGGLYDHIGGGFFRYSSDERWMNPYFEKTLYDSAMIMDVCTSVWQFNRNELCRQRISETIGWMLREMKVGNAFAAGIGSDTEGEEGKFYLWSEAEIDAALVGTFSARFKQVYGVSRDGNYMGKNILRRLGNPAPNGEADEALLARQREMLLAARNKRARPGRDDTVIADWNGLAIAAIARAGIVLEKPEWISAAIAAFDDVVKTLGADDRLFHSALNGKTAAGGFADDYASMARAALQLWEVTGEARFLDAAKTWTKTLNAHFWSKELGGYCFTGDDAAPLWVRQRSILDQPTPSANGTMLTVLTRLAFLTGEKDYMSHASTLGVLFGDEMNRVLNMAGTYLGGIEYLGTALMVVIVGHKGNARTHDLVRTYWGKAMPNALLIQLEPGDKLPADHPATGKGMEGGLPTAYVVQQGRITAPITNPQVLAQGLTLPYQLQQQRSA